MCSFLFLSAFATLLLSQGALASSVDDAATTADDTRRARPVYNRADEQKSTEKNEETRRDRAVLEAALNDLASPRNPEYEAVKQNQAGARDVVFNDKTLQADWVTDLIVDGRLPNRNAHGEDPRSVPTDLGDDFKRRGRKPSRSLADFRPANRHIIVRDLDGLLKEADNEFGKLRTMYPTSSDFVSAYLPGYSRDGRSSIVVFEGVDGLHGHRWVYKLSLKGKLWLVDWRHVNFDK
jgi:hypothetical protein